MSWDRDIRRLAAQFDAKVERTGRGHYRFTLPNGQICGTSGTPSDHRVFRNTRAQLRRATNQPGAPMTRIVVPPPPPAPPAGAPVSANASWPPAAVTAYKQAVAALTAASAPTPPPEKKKKNRRHENKFRQLTPEERQAREAWVQEFLRAGEVVPTQGALRDAFKAKFNVLLTPTKYGEYVRAELARRGLAPRPHGWRPGHPDRAADSPAPAPRRRPSLRPAAVEALVVELLREDPSRTLRQINEIFHQRGHGIGTGALNRVITSVKARAARAGLSTPKARPAAQAPAQGDFQAAVELLLAAVPNLAKLTISVGEDGEASVDYTTRVVQEQTGRFQVKGGR